MDHFHNLLPLTVPTPFYRWVWVYGLLVGLVLLISVPRSALFFLSSVQASTKIHDTMAICVMRAPLSFFHTNPVGRVLNRLVFCRNKAGLLGCTSPTWRVAAGC